MATTIKRGQTYRRRRTGVIRTVEGFTTKPDGIRRARMIDPNGELREARVKVDQLLKSYQPV